MKTVRSALLAAAILAGIPSLAFAQPPEDGGRGGRPIGPGRMERAPDTGPRQAMDQGSPRGQFQSRQGNDFGGRRDFRNDSGDQGQAPIVAQGQRPEGFGRNPARFGQSPQSDVNPPPANGGRFDGRRDDGQRRDFNGDNRFRGANGPANDDRFDGRTGRYNNDNRFDGRDGRFSNDNRFDGRNGRFGNDNRFDGRGNNSRFNGGNQFRPDWRNDRRYDWQGYRNNNRQLFRAPRYLAPRGYSYGYRPFARGYQLQPFFYGQNYWINDPWLYRLPPAYGPYRWVRYYNDVLLVDIDTGFVVDVIQNFFW